MTGHIVTRRRLGRSARPQTHHHPDQLSSTTHRPLVVACSSGLQYIHQYRCYSRLSHPRLVGGGGGGGVRGLRCQALCFCCKTASCHQALLPPRRSASGAPGPKRQLDVSSILGCAALLQLCHTAAAVPVLYYIPRMHACSLLCRPHADRHSLDGLVRTLPGLSRVFLALLASPTALPPLLAAPLAAVGQRESLAHIHPSAIPDLPFLQAEWR